MYPKNLYMNMSQMVLREFFESKKSNKCASFLLGICSYLTPLGQARQFLETCGT